MNITLQEKENAKKAAGYHAANLVEDGMCLGLGTGSTAKYFIERVIQRVKEGLNITAIASSKQSGLQALGGNISLISPDQFSTLDLTVDGADQINADLQMIKGGGGALMREKILAEASRSLFIIADSSKHSKHLTYSPLPVEILPFGVNATIDRIKKLGYKGELRKTQSGQFFVSDNKNYIYDITIKEPIASPNTLNTDLLIIPGVLATGLFLNPITKLIVGKYDGEIEVYG